MNGKIIRKKRGDYTSISLLIVKNYRKGGLPTSEVIKYIGTVHSDTITQSATEFWKKADAVIGELVAESKILKADAEKIERQFAAVVPRPKIENPLVDVPMVQTIKDRLRALGRL